MSNLVWDILDYINVEINNESNTEVKLVFNIKFKDELMRRSDYTYTICFHIPESPNEGCLKTAKVDVPYRGGILTVNFIFNYSVSDVITINFDNCTEYYTESYDLINVTDIYGFMHLQQDGSSFGLHRPDVI